LLEGLIGGCCGKPGVAVGVQDDLVALKMLQASLGIEVSDLGADQDLEIPHVETIEGGYADLGAFTPFPELRHRGADRRGNSKTRHDDTVWYRGPLHLYVVPIAERAGGAWRCSTFRSSLRRRCARALDEGAHPIHDRADRLEVGRFFVGIVRNFDAEGVFDVEHDHR